MGKRRDHSSEEVVPVKRKKDIDVDHDITGNFFEEANKTIAESSLKTAVDLKYYVNIIANLNNKYQQLRSNFEALLPKVDIAEQKLYTALQLTASSDDCMEQLKGLLAEAWRAVDASHFREQSTQEKLLSIDAKNETLYERKASVEDAQELGSLGQYKNILLRERDRLNLEARDLKKRLETHRNYTESLEYINEKHSQTIRKLHARTNEYQAQNERLYVKNHNLMNIIGDIRSSQISALQKLDTATKEIAEYQSKIAKQAAEMERMRLSLERAMNEKVALNRQILNSSEELKAVRKDKAYVDGLYRAMILEDKSKIRTIKLLRDKNKKSIQYYNQVSKKLYKLDRLYNALREENATVRNTVSALRKEINSAAAKYHELNAQYEFAQRDRNMQRDALKKAQKTITDLKHAELMSNALIDDLKLDMKKMSAKIDENMGIISRGERDRNNLEHDILNLNDRITDYQAQLVEKGDQIDELTEKREQLYASLNSMKKQLDSAHSNNFLLKRKLDSCCQDSDDMKNSINKKNYQISQMSNEIAGNNTTIISLKSKIDRVYTEKKLVQSTLQATEATLESVRKDLKDMKYKNENLHKIISDDEFKILKISQELEDTRKERTLEGLQLVRRNDEMILLKDKICIMQHALDNGTSSYNQRIEDIRILKAEILQLQHEVECLKRAVASSANQREELIRLQRKLNQEQAKVRSLTEDMKVPTGVHRWRILKGEDPSRFEMIQKIQALQKRNVQLDIKYKSVIVELEKLEENNKALKNNVAHLLKKDNVEKKLVVYQRINREQEKKLKSLTAELRITELEIKDKDENYKSVTPETFCKIQNSKTQNQPINEVCASKDSNEEFQDQNLFEFSSVIF